jgi:hypothetical protein
MPAQTLRLGVLGRGRCEKKEENKIKNKIKNRPVWPPLPLRG